MRGSKQHNVTLPDNVPDRKTASVWGKKVEFLIT